MRPFEPGDPGLVGGLWLSGRLGEGPLGVVFLGQQADGTKVAVKLLHAHLTEDPAVWDAYQRAMESLVELSVPHTARALSTGLVGARPYLMSEYVEGIPLPDINEPFSPAELDRLALRTATALAALHAAGIAHGALRPSNVIMSAQGAVLTDYGLNPDNAAAMAADLPDWARLLKAAAGEQELPSRLRTLAEACLSAVPPSTTELLRQLTAPSSDPSVTLAELASPPAAFGRPVSEPAPSPAPSPSPSPEAEPQDGPEPKDEPPAPQAEPPWEKALPEQPPVEVLLTSLDTPLPAPSDLAAPVDPAAPAETAPAGPALDQTVLDAAPHAAAPSWAVETRMEELPGFPAEPPAGPAAPVPPPPVPPSFDAPPPWVGEEGAGGPKRALLVVAASVTVALVLVGVFAVSRSGGEADPEPVAAKTGVVPTAPTPTLPTATVLPTGQPTGSPTAPVKELENAGSPTPTPKKTPTPTPGKKKPKPPRNLLGNGGFEKGFGGWQPRAVAFLGAKAAHSGRHAVQLRAGNGYDAAVEYVVTGLKPNTTYLVTGWVTSDVGATFIGAKDFGPVSSYVSSTSKKWTRLSVKFKTGAGTTARIYCWRNTPGTGACDDMALYKR